MSIVAKRTVMNLFSDPQCAYSHQVRIVLAEKAVNVEIKLVSPDERLDDLADINPYYSVPTLVDRELVLFESRIIMEYLDERFPHPPLLPVYPVARAESRKIMYRIENDWYSLTRLIQNGSKEEADVARTQLFESFVGLAPIFADKQFFLSEEFSLVDCCVAPLLWRFPSFGLDLKDLPREIRAYAKRVFSRPTFQASLTDIERELQAA
jgi:RNA polymerase-associated protein